MASKSPRLRHPRPLDAGRFAADIASFELHLAAENKAAATIRIYTEAPRWFAAAHLLPETDKTRWDQVDVQDVQRWMVWLLRHYSETYAYQQYRSLQQFFRWLAAEDEIADPMARLRAPKVADKPVPFFTSVELSKLEKACQGSTFAQRRDAAILAVFRATGIRLSELAGIRYHPDDPSRSDVDLQRREIYIRGKRGKDRQARQGPDRADRSSGGPLGRSLPPGPGQARTGLPLAATARGGDRGPLTASRTAASPQKSHMAGSAAASPQKPLGTGGRAHRGSSAGAVAAALAARTAALRAVMS